MVDRTVDMVIEGGKIISPESTVEANIAVDGGVIVAVGAGPTMPAARETIDASGMLVLPGIIDSHVHYVQLDIMASYGRQLLDWLNDYTFPAECRFADAAYAQAGAERFLDEMLRVGTTTAQVFCSSHPVSVDSFFSAASSFASKRPFRPVPRCTSHRSPSATPVSSTLPPWTSSSSSSRSTSSAVSTRLIERGAWPIVPTTSS